MTDLGASLAELAGVGPLGVEWSTRINGGGAALAAAALACAALDAFGVPSSSSGRLRGDVGRSADEVDETHERWRVWRGLCGVCGTKSDAADARSDGSSGERVGGVAERNGSLDEMSE